MHVVVDTNVILVANGSHADVSPECIIECVDRLANLMKNGKVVIDDAHRILNEYQNKTTPIKNKRPGDVFVMWLLRNAANTKHVERVTLTEPAPDEFDDFPDQTLQPAVDAPDRKFLATAGAHPQRPEVWQATDSKWLDWWQPLKAAGVTVEFLCGDDVCRFYAKKFPGQVMPPLP
jgi:hypothetical protein